MASARTCRGSLYQRAVQQFRVRLRLLTRPFSIRLGDTFATTARVCCQGNADRTAVVGGMVEQWSAGDHWRPWRPPSTDPNLPYPTLTFSPATVTPCGRNIGPTLGPSNPRVPDITLPSIIAPGSGVRVTHAWLGGCVPPPQTAVMRGRNDAVASKASRFRDVVYLTSRGCRGRWFATQKSEYVVNADTHNFSAPLGCCLKPDNGFLKVFSRLRDKLRSDCDCFSNPMAHLAQHLQRRERRFGHTLLIDRLAENVRHVVDDVDGLLRFVRLRTALQQGLYDLRPRRIVRIPKTLCQFFRLDGWGKAEELFYIFLQPV